MLPFIVSSTLLAVGTLLQTTNALSVGLIKPNLGLALLVVIAHFEKSWAARSFFIFLSALILTFSPAIGWLDVVFVAVAFFLMGLADYLPWRPLLAGMFAITVGTLLMNFPLSNVKGLATELAMNNLLVVALLFLLQWVYASQEAKQKSRF